MTQRRLTAAAVALLGLTACSSPAAPTAAPPSPSAAAHAHHGHQATGPAPSGAPGGTVVVHAADELRPSLTQLVPKFEEGFTGIRIAVEYGPGPAHAQHILAGAPVDVFVSADATATTLVTAAHIRGTATVVARNPIVVAVPRTTPDKITAITDLSTARVALCADTLPCGRAARTALQAAAVDVQPATVTPAPAAALRQVRSGAADAALVHRTDVVTAADGLRAVDFAQAAGTADEYTALKVTTGPNPVGADAFVTFLSSALARHIFADAGLSPV